MPCFFLICTWPGCNTQDSTSHGIYLRIRLLQGSSRLTNNYTGLTSSGSIFVSTLRTMNAFVAGQQGLFQAPNSVPCESFAGANLFEACFVDVLAWWLFACKTPGAGPAFMNVVELWEARVAANDNDILVCSHCYEHVVRNRLDLLLVLRIYESCCQKEQLLFGSSCSCPKAFLELHCRQPLIKLVPFL